MVKKAVIAIFILVLTLSLIACNQSDKRVETNDINYKITEFTDSKSTDILKYNIEFPQLSGLSDVDKQSRINSTLKDEAIKVLKYYEEPTGFVEVNIDYKVVLETTNVLSIQYSGVGFVNTAAHPNNLFYTTNINIKAGERLRLLDIVNIDGDLANKFTKGEFQALWPEQGEALQHITNEEIKRNFEDADTLDYIGTEKQSDVFSYFTNDSLGISVSVSHAIGDHAEFEIKYKDIKDNIKTENEIWNELLKPNQ